MHTRKDANGNLRESLHTNLCRKTQRSTHTIQWTTPQQRRQRTARREKRTPNKRRKNATLKTPTTRKCGQHEQSSAPRRRTIRLLANLRNLRCGNQDHTTTATQWAKFTVQPTIATTTTTTMATTWPTTSSHRRRVRSFENANNHTHVEVPRPP